MIYGGHRTLSCGANVSSACFSDQDLKSDGDGSAWFDMEQFSTSRGCILNVNITVDYVTTDWLCLTSCVFTWWKAAADSESSGWSSYFAGCFSPDWIPPKRDRFILTVCFSRFWSGLRAKAYKWVWTVCDQHTLKLLQESPHRLWTTGATS